MNLKQFYWIYDVIGCEGIFSELTTEATKMADYISLRVRKLVHLHFTPGFRRFLWCLFRYFKDDQEALLRKGWILIQFMIMNAIALRKILKKYDKVSPYHFGKPNMLFLLLES